MNTETVVAAVFGFLVVSSAAFVVDATAGQRPAAVPFDDTISFGLTEVAIREADANGYVIPKGEAFYSGYRYVVGYYGVGTLVADLYREGRREQFGRPLAVYVTDFADVRVDLTPEGYITTAGDRDPGWVLATEAAFVVNSEARTPAGPAVMPFSSRARAAAFADEHGGEVVTWSDLSTMSFGGGTRSRAEFRDVVAQRHAWADRTVAAATALRDRPVSVVVGEDAPTLAAAIERAPPNTTVRLPPGTYAGNVTVDKPLTVAGAGDEATTVAGDGNGTVFTVTANRTAIVGLNITGVGDTQTRLTENTTNWDRRVEMAYGRADAGVVFDRANGSLVADVTITTPANGITFRDSDRGVVANVTVYGRQPWTEGYMDVIPIRSRVVVQDSAFHGGRDAIYTHRAHGSVVRDNVMTGVRFGVHEMYTSRTLVANNTVSNATTGVIVMTRPTGNAVVGNYVTDSRSGVAVAGSDSFIADNVAVENRYGMYVYAFQSLYVHNTLVRNDIGARSSTLIPTNTVVENDFAGNDRAVLAVLGPLRIWSAGGRGNYWAGAPGADRNGDGVLDRSYYPTGAIDRRVGSVPGARTLATSPAVATLRQVQDVVPAMRPTGVVDTAPLARPARPAVLEALNASVEGVAT